MKVIIAGGRDFVGRNEHREWLRALHEAHKFTAVICGGAAGADAFGADWASATGIPVTVCAADWDAHGRAAGPLRNRHMAEIGDALAVFPGGRGTASMRREAQKRGLTIWEWS